jgi:hypothetical protein
MVIRGNVGSDITANITANEEVFGSPEVRKTEVQSLQEEVEVSAFLATNQPV